MRMDKRLSLVLAASSAALALSACSEASETGASVDYAEAEAAADATSIMAAEEVDGAPAEAASEETARIPALDAPGTLPKIAYTYAYGFSLAGEKIVPLQQRHADMCEAKGPSACRILSMRGANVTDGDGSGRLELAVRAEMARSFGSELSAAASDSEAEATEVAINGEDLSKQMVDTEARLQARTVLRDRLLETLRTRRGTVAELVEAERSVAQVNEEIDQARSWLNEMRGRVAFSRMTIDYESSTPVGGNFAEPISDAFGNVGGILGTVIAWLMMLGAAVLPVGLFVWLCVRINRWAVSRRAEPAASES